MGCGLLIAVVGAVGWWIGAFGIVLRAYASVEPRQGYAYGAPEVVSPRRVRSVAWPRSGIGWDLVGRSHSLLRVPASEFATTLVVLDLVGIFVFAVTGALVAVRKNLDLFAALVLAGVTGLGGGFIRDVLIGVTPPAALADWRYLIVPVVAGLVTFAFHPTVGRLERVVTLFDAFGLALFCVTGALKAVEVGLGPVPAALMGMVTAIGGGMIRDVLAGRVPVIFEGALYATPALAGAAVAVVLDRTGLPLEAVAAAGFATCLGWRLLALFRGWQAPMPRGPANV
jgi:uncharacterized membrane protein YeiH